MPPSFAPISLLLCFSNFHWRRFAFPFSFVSSPKRFAFWRSASLVWKRMFIQYSHTKQRASGSVVRFNYLTASQVVDAGWFIHFTSNPYTKISTRRKRISLFKRDKNKTLFYYTCIIWCSIRHPVKKMLTYWKTVNKFIKKISPRSGGYKKIFS